MKRLLIAYLVLVTVVVCEGPAFGWSWLEGIFRKSKDGNTEYLEIKKSGVGLKVPGPINASGGISAPSILTLKTDNTTRVTIDSAGNVGIGKTPSKILDVPSDQEVGINLTQLNDVNTSSPSDGQYLRYNATSGQWEAASSSSTGSLSVKESDGTPTINDVSLIEFNQATGLKVESGGTGIAKVSTSVAKSLQFDGNNITLVNDSTSNAPYLYYGTDGSGTKGFFNLPASLTGNWVLVRKFEYSNQGAVSDSIPWDGDVDSWIMIRSQIRYASGGTARVGIRLNNDSTNYQQNSLSQTGSTVTGSTNSDTCIPLAGVNSTYPHETTIVTGYLKNTGDMRYFYCDRGQRSSSSYWQLKQMQVWKNTTDKVSSIQIVNEQTSSGTFTGIIEIYKWQNVVPVDLVSYELVKEWNLNNETFNQTIPWDGDIDDVCVVDFNLKTSVAGASLVVRPNSDSGNNYDYAFFYNNGTSMLTAQFSSDSTGMFLSSYGEYGSAGRGLIYLKNNGNYRQCFSNISCRRSSPNSNYVICSTSWKNTSSKVTSLNFYITNSSNATGFIRVYRMTRAHLICSDPGLLKGMWLKYVDANTVQVQPGDIEIGGIIHSLYSPTNVTLSGNLRSGESEAANTMYYLYAVKPSAGRTPEFKFSSVKPTMNRFGNIISDLFETATQGDSLYHPNEGLTWRYIGHVWNNASSDINSFTKVYPFYNHVCWAVRTGSNQSVPANNTTTVAYNSVVEDPFGEFNTSTSTFTCKRPGLYAIFGGIYNSTDSGLSYACNIVQNSNNVIYEQLPTGNPAFTFSTVVRLALNDTIKVTVYAGTSFTIYAATHTYLKVQRISD